MTPRILPFHNATAFLLKCEPFLMENEVASELVLGVALQQAAGVSSAMTTRFYAAFDGQIPVLAAMHTPDVWPTMTGGSEEAATVLARYLFQLDPGVPRVHGPQSVVAAFAIEWKRLSGRGADVTMRQRIHCCKSVNEVPQPDGAARRSTETDTDLILRWNGEFHDELQIAVPSNEVRIRERAQQGRYFLWDVGEPVCLAGHGRETKHVATVGPVYTPPAFRGRGYATACTAVVTQAILDDGKRYASLYTDLDNPTSNSIYQKIGYKPVCDVDLWRFI